MPVQRVDRLSEKALTHVNADESAAKGRTARVALPRSVHAVWEAPVGRRSPIEVIAEQATSRDPTWSPFATGA